MKIELINENKIKCVLSKSDLKARDIDIDSLTYGSPKAKLLFDELKAYASSKFDISFSDCPVYVEAIPTSNENLIITITKSQDPEELDTRFSKFTPTPEDIEKATLEENEDNSKYNKANEILNLLSSFKDALKSTAEQIAKEADKTSSMQPASLVFEFDEMDKLISLSKALVSKYKGTSSIYKKEDNYYLLINNNHLTPEEFNQICNILCEYGNHTRLKENAELYFSEHCELIISKTAIPDLALIS